MDVQISDKFHKNIFISLGHITTFKIIRQDDEIEFLPRYFLYFQLEHNLERGALYHADRD